MPTAIKHITKKKRISIKQPIVSYQHKKVTLSESIDSKNYLRMKLHEQMRKDLKYLCVNFNYVQPTKLIADLLKLTVKNLKSGKKMDKKKPNKINLGRVTNLSGLHPSSFDKNITNKDIEETNGLIRKIIG